MRRVTAVLSTGLTADRPDGLLTMSVAATQRQPAGERVVCSTAIRRELVWDTHKQAHAGAQRVLTKLQCRWYWPYMEHEMRRRVRQCETCQANKHGRPLDEAGRWKQNVEGPWQVKAVNLVGSLFMAPQGDVVGRERPLPAREARPLAPRPPPPLLEPSTGSEVQKPSEEGLHPEILRKLHHQNSTLGKPQCTERT